MLLADLFLFLSRTKINITIEIIRKEEKIILV